MTRPAPAIATERHQRDGYNISRVLRTLELLADGPQSAIDVAARLAVHPRTARRILYRLTLDGYLRRTPTWRGRFTIAPRLVHLGYRLADPSPLLTAGPSSSESGHEPGT